MEYGWHLREEGVLFVLALLSVFALLYFTTELGIRQNFGTSFLIAAIATALEVVFTSSKHD